MRTRTGSRGADHAPSPRTPSARGVQMLAPARAILRPGAGPGALLTPADVLRLQRTVGNRAVGRLLNTGAAPVSLAAAPGIQRIAWDDAALKAAAKAVKLSGMSVRMIAEGYEPILDAEQKKSLRRIKTLRNLLRYKDEMDTRSDVRKVVSEALGLIAYFDPTQIASTLNKLEQAVAKLQQAKAMYDENKQGTADPIVASSAVTTYGST